MKYNTCPKCRTKVSAGLRECPECGNVFPPEKSPLPTIIGSCLLIAAFSGGLAFNLRPVEASPAPTPAVIETLAPATPVPTPAVAVGSLLEQYREETMFYLQHDLTLNQLAIAIGTNRTYLSSYFATQGITYNTYINRLRVEHFIRLYRKAVAEGRLVTAMEIARQSGYSSYSTFSIAFKRFTGTTVAEWMKREEKV
jgi:AraC-like DNA-binding protein